MPRVEALIILASPYDAHVAGIAIMYWAFVSPHAEV